MVSNSLVRQSNEVKVVSVNSFSDDFFYNIPRDFVFANTSPVYRRFLREAGLVDLSDCEFLGFGKTLLRENDDVSNAALRLKVNYERDDGSIVVISQDDSRKLVKELDKDCFLVPVGLMYKVVIPYLKDLEEQNLSDVKETLGEMRNYAGWLEDKVLDMNILVVGGKSKKIGFINKSGYFDNKDLNIYGYPTKIRNSGEYYFWNSNSNCRAAIRDWSSELDLDLNWEPSNANPDLGVHVAKFFSSKKSKK